MGKRTKSYPLSRKFLYTIVLIALVVVAVPGTWVLLRGANSAEDIALAFVPLAASVLMGIALVELPRRFS